MAPESAHSHMYSIKSDVFSYGVVLYEIVTRGEPWKGMSAPMAIASKSTERCLW
jgi:serine/threonine protein kinase